MFPKWLIFRSITRSASSAHMVQCGVRQSKVPGTLQNCNCELILKLLPLSTTTIYLSKLLMLQHIYGARLPHTSDLHRNDQSRVVLGHIFHYRPQKCVSWVHSVFQQRVQTGSFNRLIKWLHLSIQRPDKVSHNECNHTVDNKEVFSSSLSFAHGRLDYGIICEVICTLMVKTLKYIKY